MVRSEAEIRAELERAKALVIKHRNARRFIEAALGAVSVAALVWTLGESEDPRHRVKIKI